VGDDVAETAAPTPTAFRIRWGWFIGCIVLGLAAIGIGWLVAPELGYLAGVLANAGTTLLLVGVVILLERRIIDNAVRVVRRANEQSDEGLRAQIRDLEDRLAAVWKSATAEDVARRKAETTRLTDEFTQRVVDEATGES
jgi:4-amino-4-deoxy-L-arabinose transferase-like glycosyltransferase